MNNINNYLKNVTLLAIDCIDADRTINVMEICQKEIRFGAVKLLTSLDTDYPNVIRIPEINSIEKYSEFVIKNLDNYIDTEFALIIQYDGFILNPEAWSDGFLENDYVGAPWLVADWSVSIFGFPKELLGKFHVGNGGFSLRSKRLTSLCKKLAEENKITNFHPEDVAICVYYRKLFEESGIKFAPVEIAKRFSYEAEDEENITWDGQFGFHGLKWTDISKWSSAHPEYKIENPAAL